MPSQNTQFPASPPQRNAISFLLCQPPLQNLHKENKEVYITGDFNIDLNLIKM